MTTMMMSSNFGAKKRISEPPKMFGVHRVSVFATDRWSYGNQTADRKSTIGQLVYIKFPEIASTT